MGCSSPIDAANSLDELKVSLAGLEEDGDTKVDSNGNETDKDLL